MKIAIVTNDGKIVSQHFGRSQFYKIFTVEESEKKRRLNARADRTFNEQRI